jgi:hypothetical protein
MRGSQLHSHLRPRGLVGRGALAPWTHRGTYMYVGFSLDAGGANDPSILFPLRSRSSPTNTFH